MVPSIEAAKKLALILDTTVGYLLGESDDTNLLKDPTMLKRLNDINHLQEKDRDNILYTLDGLLRDAKARQAYGN